MIDKSQDYKYQNSYITIWYLPKTVEGDLRFNSNSIGVFKSIALEVQFVVRNAQHRTGQLQVEHSVFHMWRSVCGGIIPALGDKLCDGITFWLVDEVEFADLDDSGFHQRYRLTVTRTNQQVKP